MATSPKSDESVERRRDDALRRALSTPPKPKQDSAKLKEQKPKKQPKKDQV